MKMEMSQEQLKELENQLSCPNGEHAKAVADNMHETNQGMTFSTVDFLAIKDNNEVLELGHGNCAHLSKIMEAAKNVQYTGLEVSDAMYRQAQHQASQLGYIAQSTFKRYDGNKIPFPDRFFDRVMSVNTIYFWEHPVQLLNEISRVLQPNGSCVITFAQKTFMEQLPFVGEKFQLYDADILSDLVAKSNLKIDALKDQKEEVKSKAGDAVTRFYTMAKLVQK